MRHEFIFSDVPYRADRHRRQDHVLGAALGFVFLNGAIFAAIGLATSSYAMCAIQGSFAAGALGLLLTRGRLVRSVVAHATFWLTLCLIVLNLFCFEGMGSDVRPVSHVWFLVLAAGSGLVFRDQERAWLASYLLLSFALFCVVEFSTATFPPLVPQPEASMRLGRGVAHAMQFITLVGIVIAFVREIAEAEKHLSDANSRLEDLLANMLPASIADRLRAEGRTFADGYANCSVLFADIVGFTPMSAAMPPLKLVEMLDDLFSEFDVATEELGLEKIKTIGDSYMVAAGLPTERPDHATVIVELALRLQEIIRAREGLGLRIGINSGEVVAGIIGRKRFIYDLWGDTVNIASRMESQGLAGEIQIGESTHRLVSHQFDCERRGRIEIKGRGALEVFLVKGGR